MRSNWSTDRPELPEEQQERIFELLSQETRHLIIQFVLGHPEHLMSLPELDCAIPKDETAVKDQLDVLIEAGLLNLYCYEPNEAEPNVPSEFYGPTERGIEILYKFKYLRGVPVLQALYQNTKKSDEVERYETAPRPELPTAVQEALSIGGDCESVEQVKETSET